MSDPYLTINGTRADTARLRVNDGGRWLVDLDFVGTPPAGAATVRIGALELKGTVARSSAFLGKARVRVMAGGYGWGKTVAARYYHNDGLQRRAHVLTALAKDVGETIETTGDTTTLRVDFTRASLPAWRVLELALGTTPWRINYDGVTRYSARPRRGAWAPASKSWTRTRFRARSRSPRRTVTCPDPLRPVGSGPAAPLTNPVPGTTIKGGRRRFLSLGSNLNPFL